MKAARKISTLVLMFLVLLATAFAQEHHDGNLAEQQKAPTVLGGTGLFNTFSTRTLCKGEFNFALFWNNFDRDPGDIDVNQVPFNITLGLTNRWEIWVNWITWQNTTSRQPFLLSGYQYNASRFFGTPFNLLGPPVGGRNGSEAAFFPGGGALTGGILPALGRFGQPVGFPSSIFSPGGAGASQVVGLGPLMKTDYPNYNPEFPLFGEVDFQGFDGLGRPVFGPRESSNGTGDVYVGTKFSLIDANKHWFSMALGGYLKIPVSSSDDARARGRTSGEFEYGPMLMFGQESGGKRFRLYENIGYIHTTDPSVGDVKVLDLPDKMQFNVGMSIAPERHIEFIGEILHTQFVGSRTPSLVVNSPWDMNVGMRFYFKEGRISFGAAYRRFLNNEDQRTIPVFVSKTIFVAPFFIINPTFTTQDQTFGSGGQNGFVVDFNIGTRRRCPAQPAPTCVLAASATSVNKGERLTLSSTPSTPGYTNDKVTYEYRWEVKDAQGRPVTVSGNAGSVEVPTTGLACGRYSVTTTVTATVPQVDCPSDCVTTGTTSCATSFEITEPPCPTVTCDISANPTSVIEGDRISLHANASGADGATFTWSVSGGGTLSSTSGTDVTLDTSGLGLAPTDSRTTTVTVNVSTTRSRCDQPCPGSSCTVSVTIKGLEGKVIPPPISPCGPIFFPFNSARINNEHKACLDEIALRLQQDPRAALLVDGHRDSSERVGISLTRANNARDYLVNEKGVDSARVTVRNFGDTCPHESGDPNLNRRVEFWIIPAGGDAAAVDTLKKCGAGASPRLITDEQPAASDDKARPKRRAPRRRARARKPGEPIEMMAMPEAPTTNN